MESAHFGICDRGSWRRASESVRPGDGANAVLEGDPGFSEAYAPPPLLFRRDRGGRSFGRFLRGARPMAAVE